MNVAVIHPESSMTQSSISIDSAVELLGICERFEIPTPLQEDCTIAQFAKLISVRLREDGVSIEETELSILHDQIESSALAVLSDPDNDFPKELVQNRTIPSRLARMRFARMLAERTGLKIKYRNVPHAAYLPLAIIAIALPVLRFSLYGFLGACVVSLVLAIMVWSHFTSKKRTVSELADYVVSDNLNAASLISHGDIIRFLNRKFPNGIDGIDLTQLDG